MEDVVLFFNEFIELEYKSKLAQLSPDIKTYNTIIEKVRNYVSKPLYIKMGLQNLESPEDDQFYEDAKEMEQPRARTLFKIDKVEYQKEIYYMAYVSAVTSDMSYFHCFIAEPVKEKFQITIRFTYGMGRDGSTKKHWYNSGGKEIEFMVLRPIVDTIRLQPPEDDPDSMKQYNS